MKLSYRKGFTLVELSIVLVIIGFLFGAVSAGQNLIRSSQVTATIAEIEKVKQAVKTFETQYGALPGDITDSNTIGVMPSGTSSGNAIISGNEDVLFWAHLNQAKLYTGNFSGNSGDRYIITSGTSIGGVPAGKIPNSGFRIVSTANGLAISLDGYSSTNNDLAVLSPSEAFGIDQKYDDGMAATGKIMGFDGSNAAANSCMLATGAYAVSNSNITCRMTFLISGLNITAATANTCVGGYPIGSTRQSSTTACPYGQVGKVIEECTLSGGSALWVNTRTTCKPVECGFGLRNGEALNLPCPTGYLSTSTSRITLTCMPSGFLAYSNTCAIQTANACRAIDQGATGYAMNRTLACPIGITGYVTQVCTAQNWTTQFSGCSTTLQCTGAINPGSFEAAGTLNTCGNANYALVGGANITRGCRLGANATAAFDNPLHSRCLPLYTGAPCAAGNTRDIGCPMGYTGSHIQVCVTSGNYITQSDNCVPITCGTEPIGGIKISRGTVCNNNEEGFTVEVCTLNTGATPNRGDWVVHTSTCNTRYCNTRTTGDQNTGLGTYTTAAGYASNVNHAATACPTAPYTNNINNANYSNSSRCGFDGTWQARNGACLANACPALGSANTTSPTNPDYFFNMLFPQTYDYGGGTVYAPEHGTYEIVKIDKDNPSPTNPPKCNSPYGSLFPASIAQDAKVICSDRGHWVDFCNAGVTSATYGTRLNGLAATTARSCLGTGTLNSTDSAPFAASASSACSGSRTGILYRPDTNRNDVCDGTDSSSTPPKCQSCHSTELYCVY
ncbi:MAG: type II secretion system protein [Alphaproteobacteria bacterium]|nr:type II secretion system protein [Alphaproteobacteria bacterium]OJV13708.1 MAG: hypothetical protein BGO27_00865 [Alphaproteobacteria bacterium 33-17]